MGRTTYQIIEARQSRARLKNAKEAAQIEKDMSVSATLEGISEGTLYSLDRSSNITNPIRDSHVLHRAVNILAQNASQVPLRIFRGDELMPLDFTFDDGFDIQNPNPDQSLAELIYEGTAYYYYRGELMFRIGMLDEGSDIVRSLTAINPRLMREKVDKELRRIVAWELMGDKKLIPANELVYAKFFNPDGLRGLGPVEVIKNELLTDKNASLYDVEFFANFGQIGGVLFDDKGNISTEEMRKLVNEFNSRHQGSANSHKLLGLPEGIKYESAQQTMREMQFLDSRKDIRDRVLLAMGVPKEVVGITDQTNRATAEVSMGGLWGLTIKPNLLIVQGRLNHDLFKPRYKGFSCKFDFSEIKELKSDQVLKAELADKYKKLGYSLNEVNDRFQLGMDEVVEAAGSIRLVPSNMIPLDDLTDPIEPTKAVSEPLEKKIDKGLPRNYIRNHMKLERKIETQLSKKLRLFFSKELPAVQNIIKSSKAYEEASKEEKSKILVSKINQTQILMGIKTLLDGNKEILTGLVTPIYREGSADAIELAQNTIKATIVPRVSETVVNNMVNKIVGIQEHTYKLIRNQVFESTRANETILQLTKRINNVYKFNTSRSSTIARTESGTLINRSTDEEYRKQKVRKKQWVAAGDARPTHQSANAQGAIPYDRTFNNGLRYPHDPSGSAAEVVNCRCALAPIVD